MILVSDIQRATAKHYGLPFAAMTEPDGLGARLRERVRPRQAAMYLSACLTTQSYAAIGRRFHRDHSTVLHACKQVRVRLKGDDFTKDDVRAVLRRLGVVQLEPTS